MSECFTEQILLTEFIGDSLPKINNNFLKLQSVACQLSATSNNVVSFGVTNINGVVNLDVTNPSGLNFILEQEPPPTWYVGGTKKPLLQEIGINNVSQQISNESRFQKSIERIQKHNPIYLKPITKTYSTPSTFSGSNGYRKGVMLFDGKVLHIPFTSAANAIVYNYKNNTTESVVGFISVAGGFFGGVLLSNGKVYCIPHNSNTGQYFTHNEISSNRFSSVNTGSGYPGSAGFLGGVLFPNGNVFLCPRNSTNYGLFNPITSTFTQTNILPAVTNNSFYGCVLTKNGKACLIPSDNTSVYVIEQGGGTTTPVTGLIGTDKYRGGVRLSTGEIFFIPYNATQSVIFNPNTNTHFTTPPIFPGSGAYETGTLLPDGRVFMCPANRTKPGLYNPFTQEFDEVDITVNVGDYHGSVLLPNGKIYLMPRNATSGLVISIPISENFSLNTLTGPQFNKL
jgi:hypothetical protein